MILSSSLIWFLVGVAFLIAEIALSGFILIFFTAGCWIVALVTWLFEIELTGQNIHICGVIINSAVYSTQIQPKDIQREDSRKH